jgi:hypothetical protein
LYFGPEYNAALTGAVGYRLNDGTAEGIAELDARPLIVGREVSKSDF